MQHRTLFLTACVVGLVGLSTVAEAATVYGLPVTEDTSSDPGIQGDRSSTPYGSGLVGIAGTTIKWSITYSAATEKFHYQYTFVDFVEHAISHIVLDISDDAFEDGELVDFDAITDAHSEGSGTSTEFNAYGWNSSKDPQDLTGSVKFEGLSHSSGDLVLEFDSNRAPVWGHVWVKAADDILHNRAYNYDGPDYEAVISDTTNYIARPNGIGGHIVPLPAASWLGFVAIGGLAAARRWSRRQQG